MHLTTPLLLGSSSPRRLELLETVGVLPTKILSPDIDEKAFEVTAPKASVEAIALAKARHLYSQEDIGGKYVILTGDSFVYARRQIMGKAKSADEVRAYLETLSGRRHRVYSAVSVISPSGREAVKSSYAVVRFKRLTKAEINWYVATQEGIGKAGGYAVQGKAQAFIEDMHGSFSGTVGLNLKQALGLLHGMGCLKY